MNNAEQHVYEIMCARCIAEKLCHDECVTCEEFDAAVAILAKGGTIDE